MNRLNARIASTEAGLATGSFFAREMPQPQTFYSDHSSRASQGEGGQTRHGYGSVTLLWDTLTAAQARDLKAVIVAAEATASGLIYVTLARNNADNGQFDWIDISGYPIMPNFQAEGIHGAVFRNIQLVVNNITIINDPSTYN
jgi:hypothetical protein